MRQWNYPKQDYQGKTFFFKTAESSLASNASQAAEIMNGLM